MEKPQLLSGARGQIQRPNPETGQLETLAFATDITVNVRAGVQPTFVMGRMNAGGIDTLSYDVDVTIGRVIPVNSADGTVTANNWSPYSDAATKTATDYPTSLQMGLEPLINQMVKSADIVIALYDKVSEKYVASVKGCRFAGRGLQLSAGSTASESLTFVGIYDTGHSDDNQGGYQLGYGV